MEPGVKTGGGGDNPRQKAALRRQMLCQREQLGSEQVKTWSQRICAGLLADSLFQQAKTVMGYVSFRQEVDLGPLLEQGLAQGKRILLPVTDWEKPQILPVEVAAYPAGLSSGRYGLLEPAPPHKTCPLEEIDLVLVPGVAFDFKGYRLGYGKGFYDRFLSQLTQRTARVGIAFNFQLVSTVFPESHDIFLPVAFTEQGKINCLEGRRN